MVYVCKKNRSKHTKICKNVEDFIVMEFDVD